jgi:ribonucleoside-diphosphate reductase alpha chain
MSGVFQEDISEKIWDTKYRYRLHGKVIDQTMEDTWYRVAHAIAKAEQTKNQAQWQQTFYDVLAGFRFLPGGRILAGAGTEHAVTLFNCFVMPIQEDSLTGVFDALREGAMTLQQGGGVGYDFSVLRPNGFSAQHSGAIASGPVSFMRIWDAMCSTMESTGARRGAMMGILRCDHPDIEAFIAAKADSHELQHFNLSVLVTDAFMQAVKTGSDWDLVFPADETVLTDTVLRHWSGSAEPVACRVVKRVRARDLWEKITRAALAYAEPGVLFEDTINRQNNLWYREWISAANPCGEIPLPQYGACNLGSVNLAQFVLQPFTPQAAVDWTGLERTVVTGTRFLDNVVDLSLFPLPRQKQEARATRRIGLGMTGFADMLIMLGITYGSEASFEFADRLIKMITETTWHASIELARERGVFPEFSSRKYLQGNFVTRLPAEICQMVEKHGIRNSHHNAVAPAGTISLLANNVSGGIEPVFRGKYEHTIRLPNGEHIKYGVMDHALRLWRGHGQTAEFPPAFIDAEKLLPEAHLKMQAIAQKYIDNAISKTVNFPADFSSEKLAKIYTEAFELGLKGCAIFCPNPVTGGVRSPEESLAKG